VTEVAASLDRVTAMSAAMEALLADEAVAEGDADAVGTGVLVADTGCTLAGLPVAREVFGRLGARFRPLTRDGAPVGPGEPIAELGGPLAAMRGAAPTAVRLLVRLSAIASGRRLPGPGDPLDAYASRLSRGEPVGDDEPWFHLETRDPE
jgi:hypothetical protein